MSGGKGSNTTTTSTQGPAYLQSAYQDLLSRAQGVSQTPYQPYGGELVAGVNPQEQAGIGSINRYADAAQPYLNAAAGYANSAAAPITQQQIQQYENPEANQVTQATLANFNDLNAQQNQQVVGNAISSGAWGGDRSAVAQTELAKSQLQGEAPTLANINLQSYNTGLSTALSQQQQQAQAAYSLGNIGTAAQNAGLTGAGAQIQGGQLQQGTQQQLDTAQMQQYLTSLAYPYQQLSWLGGLETGVGGVAGGTSSTTAPPPNPLNTILGLGATAAGAYMGAKTGGRIPGIHAPQHFDAGGAATMPYSGGISFIPSIPMGHGAGPPKPPSVGGQQQPQAGLGNLGGAAGKYFGRSNGISTDPAGAGFPMEGSADAASLGNIVPMNAEGFGIGAVATGGHIRGYADGGEPTFDDQWASLGGLGMVAPSIPLPAPRPSVDVDNPDSAYNRGLLQRPTVGYTGTDMPVDATDIALNGGSGGLGLGAPYDASNPAIEADVGARPSRGPAVAGVNAPSAFAPSGGASSAGISAASYPSFEPPADGRSLGQKLSLPLMQAGFAMMASRSPFVGEAIGQGGLSGIGAYVGQEKEARTVAEKQQEIGLRAKQLSDLADQHAAALKQQTSNQQQQRELEERKLSQPQVVPIGGTLVDRSTGKPLFSSSAGSFSLGAIEIGGRRLAAGDATAFQGLPQGTAGAAVRTALANKAAEVLVKEQGMSPQDAASFVTATTQQVHANAIGAGAGARTAATREANLNIILKAADAAIPAAIDASEKLDRTGWVPLNKIIQGGRVIASDPDQKRFGMANLQLAEHWARAMNPTGVMRESDRDMALGFLNTADSKDTYRAAVDQLRTQIERERAAVQSVKGGTAAPGAPPAGGALRTPTQSDLDYVRAHPETRDKFVAAFGAQP